MYTGVTTAYFHCVGIIPIEKNDWNSNDNGNTNAFMTFLNSIGGKPSTPEALLLLSFLIAALIFTSVKSTLLYRPTSYIRQFGEN